ncbi:nucleotide-binding domain-containing protein [Mycena maculata]|uniref:Nucleotide-binding domain-containing protein n=1 Tax=Mycena maculata TaxID=230809 RepID=A0AAD7NKD2_9AGAR|nr:nucleotide-binding domain-containing protein [Mycena maculata]
MGSALSRLRLSLQSFRAIATAYDELNKRIQKSPGIPVSDPSTSYWEMPASPIARHGSESILPSHADIVIIGSGVTGTAFSRTLLGFNAADSLQIVMLEARDACSGATGRNGGHITPPLYHDYLALKKEHGPEMAKSIIEFRLAHFAELIQVSKEENILADSQCREVETFDVFFEQEMFDLAVRSLTLYINEMPEQSEAWRLVGKEECVQDLQFSTTVVGAIATTAGSIHPYRFVTGVLSRLIARHSTNFRLFTHTPCFSISSNTDDLYTISTSKGIIRAQHIIHATNAWASHLLPPMRAKIVPVRGHMSAQRPGMGLGRSQSDIGQTRPAGASDSVLTLADPASWLGRRSFVMYSGGMYDYLTQQPLAPLSSQSVYPPPAAEFMLGGGAARGEITEQVFLNEVGVADDRDWSLETGAHLGGALSMYFGGWGAEGRDIEGKSAENLPDNVPAPESEEGRVKKLWTGILGISADGRPWVGRIPAKVSGRPAPRMKKHKGVKETMPLASPGEWIAAGYSGEGMPHAYLSAKALAHMVLGHTAELPGAFLVTEARWKKAKIEDLITASIV